MALVSVNVPRVLSHARCGRLTAWDADRSKRYGAGRLFYTENLMANKISSLDRLANVISDFAAWFHYDFLGLEDYMPGPLVLQGRKRAF